MTVPTDEQIEKWQKRWDKYPGLRLRVASILTGGIQSALDRQRGQFQNDSEFDEEKEINLRLEQVRDLLPQGDFERFDREERGYPVIDLRGINFGGVGGASNLKAFIGVSARLQGSILNDIYLHSADLRFANLDKASLTGANLSEANLDEAHLNHADLTAADLTGASFEYAELHQVDMRFAILRSAIFLGTKMHRARIESVTGTPSTMKFVRMDQATISNVSWVGVDLIGAVLTRAIITQGVHFEQTNLEEASFGFSQLDDVHLECSKLNKTNFNNCTLKQVRMDGANLELAEFKNSEITDVSFMGSILDKANFSGATFENVRAGKIKQLDDKCQLEDEYKEKVLELSTRFSDCIILPKRKEFFENFHWIRPVSYFDVNWKKLWQFDFERWFYTNFNNLKIDGADTEFSRELYYYVKDQQYLRNYLNNHRLLYIVWRCLSGCGQNPALFLWWNLFFIVFFACLYSILPVQTTNAFPEFLIMTEKPIDSEAYKGIEVLKWWFISFDIFSNIGVLSVTANNIVGSFLVMLETALGMIALGLLINLLHNMWTIKR
jgi:uncharacterized protein YjbI with pentapeptide repeats